MNPVEKAEKMRLRKNELARQMRIKRGEELREKQREYVRRNREKVKREAEEYIEQKARDEVKTEVKKTEIRKQEQPEIKIEKDKGELKSRAERLGEKGVSEKTAKDYISKISVIHKELSQDELDKELLKKILLGDGTEEDSKSSII